MKTKIVFVAAALLVSVLNPSVAQLAHADGAPSDLAYFQQFLYSSSTDADGNITTRFLMNSSIPLNADSSIVALVNVFLVQDGTFVVDYSEMQSNGFPITMDQHFFGNWSVPSSQLILGDIALGTRGVFDGRNAVTFTFTKDLNTPGLSGKVAVFDLGFSNEQVPQQ